MSAAASLPPRGPQPASAMNGHAHGAHGPGPADSRGSDGAGPGGGPRGLFPPIADISGSASEKVNELRNIPIASLLDQGKYHFHQAKVMLSNRSHPAGAYWEYFVAYQIVADAIPSHHDYYDRIATQRNQMHRDYVQLSKDVDSVHERFMRIKNIIINDNKRNGGLHQPPASSARAEPRSSTSSDPPDKSSQSSVPPSGSYARRDDELMLPDVPAAAPSGRASPAGSPSRKPVVQPKPQSLHGRAVHHSISSTNGAGVSDLAERFAKLRGAAAPLDTASARSSQDLSVKMPTPSDYQSSRPSGPRDMPLPPGTSAPPPKLPLNTQLAASMPKEPSPTYSPARNLSLPASINPPRSTARSMVGTGGRTNSMAASSVSNHAPNANGQTDSYFPTQRTTQESTSTRRTSIGRPVELQITAERLYDYIRLFNVLLVDVRSRAEFDSGHVFVRSIICVEPASLQDGISAEQLQERLVISPDEELAMYERRNEYDLVVYYDESTKTNSFLQKYNLTDRERALKRLYDTLHEFNAEKPLKRPPIFLMGGIDAWTDLVGPQALKMSTTASINASGQTRSRALRRSPAVGSASRLNLQRRKREYVVLDPEEERQWLEEARRGRAVLEQPPEDEEEEATSPMYRTTEEFLRRYPDVEDQQSMIYPAPRAHAASQYTQPQIPPAPSRPPPSVPRVSYSGVHERELARQTSGAQPPVYVSPGRYGNIRLHKTGLINFGVTCYMNSVVQCLSANMPLTNIFLSGRYAQDLQKENWKGSKGILPEAYATLLSNLYKGDMDSLRPSTFRRVCGHFNRAWGIDEQQDAKEFLEFVLDTLHEDLNVTWNKPPLKPLSESDELARERLPRQYAARIEWGRYQHREMSLIGNLFAGQHASQLTCQTCGTTSTTYEAFWSISVEIPRDRACDVRDCLRSYCSAERLDGDDIWRCPRCKTNREAMKKITITRAPDTLVIHFKRFSASRTESARKVRTPIHFPLQGLDMTPFMEPPITPEQEAYVMQTARDPAGVLTGLKTDPAMNGPYIYNAYAVIWHLGANLSSGHYIALVKDKSKGCWRSFNDEIIKDFEPGTLPSEQRMQSDKAYVVFYERERVAGGAF